MMQPPAQATGFDDTNQVRVVLWQSGRFVHAPLTGLGTIGALAGLTPTDGVFIVGDGTTWVAESGATARTSLGLGSAAVADIEGTVSQSGGVPTGDIMERGSNGNGEYVRFADGTQFCWHTLAGSAAGATTWTFPIAFAVSITVTGAFTAGGSPHTANPIFVQYGNLGTTSVDFSARRSDTGAAQTVSCRHMAVGRWY